MRVLISRWKGGYRAVVVDDDGSYRFEVSGGWTRRNARLYVNATIADPDRDGQLAIRLARVLADAKREGLTTDDLMELIHGMGGQL